MKIQEPEKEKSNIFPQKKKGYFEKISKKNSKNFQNKD